MRRAVGLSTVAALGLALAAPASAQWYGGMGWGGWGGSSTVGGDIAHGMGVFASGVGQYNLNTAQARAINAQTAATMNEYLYQSFQIARQNYFNRTAAQRDRTTAAMAERERRLLREPSQADVVNGNALNAILNQLENPSLTGQMLDSLGGDLTLTGKQVRLIPLKFARYGIVISLDRLSADNQWPLPLNAPAYQPLREQYAQWVKEAKEWPEDKPFPDSEIVEAIGIMNQLRELARRNLQGREFAQAENFLKGHVGMLQMAREPQIQQVLDQVARIDTVALPNALAFMQVFNVGFGVAKTPEERALYTQTLYPKLRELRDRLERDLKAPIPTGTQIARGEIPGRSPTEIFHGMDWDQISRTDAPVAAPPVGAEDANDTQR